MVASSVAEVVMADNRAYFLFFGPIAVFGIIFLLSLVAATFEAVYNTQRVYLEQGLEGIESEEAVDVEHVGSLDAKRVDVLRAQ